MSVPARKESTAELIFQRRDPLRAPANNTRPQNSNSQMKFGRWITYSYQVPQTKCFLFINYRSIVTLHFVKIKFNFSNLTSVLTSLRHDDMSLFGALARERLRYFFDWLTRFGNSSSATKKFCFERHLIVPMTIFTVQRSNFLRTKP